jgi:hypothetical protein
MPHDSRGEELKVGDRILVPCRIKAIHLTEDYCNVDLETVEAMFPTQTPTTLTLNSRQTVKPRATYEYRLAGLSGDDTVARVGNALHIDFTKNTEGDQ